MFIKYEPLQLSNYLIELMLFSHATAVSSHTAIHIEVE